MYLAWYDPDRRKSVQAKMAEGVERYKRKWGREPVEVLMHPDDYDALPKVALAEIARPSARLPRNTFFVGEGESEDRPTPPLVTRA